MFKIINQDNNIGVIRYVLCLIVVMAHTAALCGVNLPCNGLVYPAVGGFFTLSGFLLFGSFQRKPELKYYLKKRANRILPPYIFIVLLCAFSLVLVSSLSWKGYFTDSGFWKYIGANLSFLNFLHPDLPGVFDGDEFYNSAVNGSLWTMKCEWVCYLLVPFVFNYLNKHPGHARLVIITLIAFCLAARFVLYEIGEVTNTMLYFTLGKQFGGTLVFFFIGSLLNLMYSQFVNRKLWILVITLTTLFAASHYTEELYYLFIQPIIISILVIWFSVIGKWGYFLHNKPDFSYDLYLFHYPVIQLMVLWGIPNDFPPFALFLIVIIIISVMSFLYWQTVETLLKYIIHTSRHRA